MLVVVFCALDKHSPKPGAAKNEEELIKIREAYTPNAFDVKLGLGGWAQLKNKRAHDPEIEAQLDYEYVKNISLWLDVKIFVFTILCLFGSGKGK